MSREQRYESQSRAELDTGLDRFVGNPVRLSRGQVQALLNELCVHLGICLTPEDYETVEANPPTAPRAFAELIMKLEGLGADDPEIAVPVLRRVLCTFEGIARPPTKDLDNDAGIVVADVVREPQVWTRMCATFPWVVEERGEIGAGLTHLEFAALRRGLERAIDAKDIATIRQVLAFVEDLLVEMKPMHPDVANALEISFFEDLCLGDPAHGEAIVPFLGPRSRARWDEIVTGHQRTAG